jgi:hypothetical protein
MYIPRHGATTSGRVIRSAASDWLPWAPPWAASLEKTTWTMGATLDGLLKGGGGGFGGILRLEGRKG